MTSSKLNHSSPDILNLTPLPLDEAWGDIAAALKDHRNLVLVAEPGAGKTTRFPARLLHSGLLETNKKILMLEPRRIAARASAARIAEDQGWTLGNEVGYQVRFENRTTPQTLLQILTEGLLAKRLQRQPNLDDIGAVILDEFHERSLHSDLAIGLLYELQELSRPDLRIIVMSATLDAERTAAYLGNCPVIKVPGRTFPVEIHHGKKPLLMDTGPEFMDSMSAVTADILEGRQPRAGDILVFLPGSREIRGLHQRLHSKIGNTGFLGMELHGSLSLADQERAIQKADRPKIVFATNIAETSLTIDGVGTVIDSGLARTMRVDALGFPRLQLSRISLSSAKQRTGRAGRQGPGLSYRHWNKLDESSMPEFDTPEILRTELSETLLVLAAQGIHDPESFSWFEKPSSQAIEIGLRLLRSLNFLDKNGRLTPLGEEALKLPLPIRLARLMLEGVNNDLPELTAQAAALLSERDIVTNARDLRRLSHGESDLLVRLHALNERSSKVDVDPFAAKNVRRVAQALVDASRRIDRKKLATLQPLSGNLNDDERLQILLLLAFPDRVCRRRRPKESRARMVGGRGVNLATFSTVETSELFVALNSNDSPSGTRDAKSESQITVASRIERSWLEAFFPRAVSKASQVHFDSETQSVQKQTATSFYDLPVEEPHLSRPSDDEAFSVLLEACETYWETHLTTHESLAPIFARIRFLKSALNDTPISLDIENVRRAFLEEICFGENRLSQVLAKPLAEAFLRHLPSELNQLLRESAPEFYTVPSGSRLRIHYPEGRAPYLEVRIQEVFGLRITPRLARERVPLSFHLLGPNFRPVQVTSDLESFWKNGYPEVRKELRARYPKHSWPEDPLTAPPIAKGRPRS